MSPPPRVGQGALDETVARHPPGPLAAARGPMDVGTRAPQGQPVASPGTRPLPRLPLATAARTESVAGRAAVRLEARAEALRDGVLTHALQPGGEAQGTWPPGG
ncbi:MAG TPA: hypothetical protein VGC99_19180, partial [Candidatus Tectomicrobia bacterium]